MNLEYHLIQYVADPLRGESRNIGVIARSPDKRGFRAIGVDREGNIDFGYFDAIAGGAAGASCWVYGEWVNWFRDLSNTETSSPEEFQSALASLESGSRITAVPGGILEMPDGGPIDDALDYLFGRLVGNPPRKKKMNFNEALERSLAESGITSRRDFMRDAEVTFLVPGGPPLAVQMFCLLESKPRTVFKVVRFKAGRTSLIRQVNDAVFSFEKVVEHGFADKEHCVVLTEKPTAAAEFHVERLAGLATLVDVTLPTAPGMIRSLVGGAASKK